MLPDFIARLPIKFGVPLLLSICIFTLNTITQNFLNISPVDNFSNFFILIGIAFILTSIPLSYSTIPSPNLEALHNIFIDHFKQHNDEAKNKINNESTLSSCSVCNNSNKNNTNSSHFFFFIPCFHVVCQSCAIGIVNSEDRFVQRKLKEKNNLGIHHDPYECPVCEVKTLAFAPVNLFSKSGDDETTGATKSCYSFLPKPLVMANYFIQTRLHRWENELQIDFDECKTIDYDLFAEGSHLGFKKHGYYDYRAVGMWLKYFGLLLGSFGLLLMIQTTE